MALYLVSIEPGTLVNTNSVQQTLNTFTSNWYRFGTSSWVIVCDVPAPSIYTLVQQHMPSVNGGVFINRLVPHDYFGAMPPKFWEWLQTWGSQ